MKLFKRFARSFLQFAVVVFVLIPGMLVYCIAAALAKLFIGLWCCCEIAFILLFAGINPEGDGDV